MVSSEIGLPVAEIAFGRPREYSRQRRYARTLFVCMDVVLVFVVGSFATWLRFVQLQFGGAHRLAPKLLAEYLGFLLLYCALLVLFCGTQKLYRGIQVRTPFKEAVATFKAVGMATTVLMTFMYLARVEPSISRFVIVITALMTAIVLVGWRHTRRLLTRRRVIAGHDAYRVLIIGDGPVARGFAIYLCENKQLGYTVLGMLSLDRTGREDSNEVLGAVDDLGAIARINFADGVFITVPSSREIVKQVAIDARRAGIQVSVIPDLYDGLAWGAPIEYLGHFPTLALHEPPIAAGALMLKRVFDTALSALALLFFTPVLALTAVAVKLESSGPVFYRSRRIGRKGRVFVCYKFRTMVENADDLKSELMHLNERDSVLFKISNDPRITWFGRFLRKYSIDELPQFWNVLRGDMSLVGPRPPLEHEFEQYSLEHLRRLDVTPGITGLWQVHARRDPSFAEYIAQDIDYIENWNIWLDFKILCKTVRVVLMGTGQ